MELCWRITEVVYFHRFIGHPCVTDSLLEGAVHSLLLIPCIGKGAIASCNGLSAVMITLVSREFIRLQRVSKPVKTERPESGWDRAFLLLIMSVA